MRFAADENFDGHILDGLLLWLPELEIVRVQDTPMLQSPDPELLAWLADENRILITHEVATMPGYVYERVRAGLPVPGIIEVRRSLLIGQAIDELALMIGVGMPEDFENLVRYIPIG